MKKIDNAERFHVHDALDVAGMVPVLGAPADWLNGTIYALEGDYVNAGISMVGSIPAIGEAVVAGKLAKKGVKALDSVPGGNRLASNAVDKADDVVSHSKQAKECITTGCFTAGTQIVVGMDYVEDEHGNLTTVYTTVNIEDIQVGDLVYSYNTLTGETELAAVTTTYALTSDHINSLTIIDEDGNEQVIETTDAHPFWVVTDDPDLDRAARSMVDENGVILYHENLEPGLNGFWVEAKDLQVGDVFLGANAELSTLTNIVRVDQSGGIAVFNFEVEGNHNYFILEKNFDYGQTCVLVHNVTEDCSVGLVRRKQNPGDVDMPDEPAALREAMRQHGVPEENLDLIDRTPNYDKNLIGPKGEPSEIIHALDENEDIIEILHHSNGHNYPDGTFELPHYHGKPKKIHINYPEGQ